ncbi:hypothetical protein ICM05_01180 [Leucobacter sp. cx-42]|uniref:hypothetical protein n=1 Tax=unclassified Leucobacter TaxID=2621730 RepID=UPI00165D6979|nr:MULTISPECIES: hypothetical protein [unclassified Leucobacter]MBC9953261.1 hypothetical protein [Leucobacter sp. cx-42]
MRIHEITFDWPKLPLSLNYRLHRMVESNETKRIRKAAEAWARTLPSMERCVVELEWFVNTRHRRDDENPVATLKPFCDGLVDGGLVPDDTAEFMVKLMPRPTYRPKKEGAGCVVFRVTEIPPAFRPDTVQAIFDRLKQEEENE